MNHRSVIIGLLARDCKEPLIRNIPRIERLGSLLGDYHVIAVENDSVDGTREVLLDWANQNGRVIVDSFIHHSRRRLSSDCHRISHMAYLRNRLLEDIWKLPAPDLVMMIDVDIEDFDVEGIVDGITHAPEGWGALFANGRSMLPNHQYLHAQYDQYAYLANDEELGDLTYNMFTTRSLAKRGRVLNKAVQTCDYYPVKSAFGGFGIYRYDAIKELKYQALMVDNHHQKAYCEHVPFHLDIIRQGYQNYVCRSMVVNNGILKVKPAVAFLLRYLPQVHAVLCDMSKSIRQLKRS